VNQPEGHRRRGFFSDCRSRLGYTEAQRSSAGEKGAWQVSDESTAVLQGQLQRAATGDPEARQRLLELTRDRLVHQARHFLHGCYARLEPAAQTDDVVQDLYL
jgi:hypothetical protein